MRLQGLANGQHQQGSRKGGKVSLDNKQSPRYFFESLFVSAALDERTLLPLMKILCLARGRAKTSRTHRYDKKKSRKACERYQEKQNAAIPNNEAP